MVFSPPPRKPPEEIGSTTHPVLGALRLMREEFHAKSAGGIFWKKHEMFRWEGLLNGVPLEVIPEGAGPFPPMPHACSTMLARLTSNELALRRQVCAQLLDLAKDWAEGGDLPEPTIESFMAGLRVECIQVYEDWAPTVFYEERDEDQAIFAGHVIEVRLNPDGDIELASIAG